MDPELAEQLEKLADLADEDLDTLEASAIEAVEALTDDPAGDLEAAAAYKDAVLKIREERQTRVTRAEERAARAAEIKAEISPLEAETNPDEVETPADPEPEPETEPEAEGTTESEPIVPSKEPIAAAAPTPARPTLSQIRERAPKPSRPRRPAFTMTAAGDVEGYSAGQRFSSLDDVGRAWAYKYEALQGSSKPGPVRVAQMKIHYPEERSLTASIEENTRRITAVASPEAILAAYHHANMDLTALTAAGGICAPEEVRYAMEVLGVTDRPVRDALISFNAARGGIRFIRPPTISTLTGNDTALTGGVAVVTEAQDASSTTKTAFAITCGTENTEAVDAVYLYLQVGEFNRRFFGEQWGAFYRLGQVRHARVAEARLLQRIAAGSTAITDGQNLGAARDLVESYTRFAAQYRSRHRMAPETPFTVLLPFWVQDMISADLLRQAPGDQTLAFTRASVNQMFAVHNLDVHWYLDDETGATTSMIYVDEGGGAGNPWITSVIGYLFPMGDWLYLDGGELNLGVEVRDSTLISQNNVQGFYESFEGAARIGTQSLKVTSTVCVSGEFSAGVDFTCPGGGS